MKKAAKAEKTETPEKKLPVKGSPGHRERVRDRFFSTRLDGMQEYEILELLLFFAIPRRDVKPEAKALLEHFGSLGKVLDAEPGELLKVPGLGLHTITLLRLIPEISSYYLEQQIHNVDLFDSPEKVANFMRMKIGGGKYETLLVMFLDSHHHLLAYRLFPGTVDRTRIYPRNIAELCFAAHASGVILGHNHPSGVCDPSPEDLHLTEELRNALQPFNIKVHDHLIVCPTHFRSLRALGMI